MMKSSPQSLRTLLQITVLLATLLFGLAGIATAAPTIQALGDLPGGDVLSRAYDVSSDGAVVVGSSMSTSNPAFPGEAFRWTSAGGIVGLGGGSQSESYGTSATGLVVVGYSSFAFRWTSFGGMVDLSDPTFSAHSSRDTSANGSVVVGGGVATGETCCEAFRWTSAGGAVGLGDLFGGVIPESHAEGVSADGAVVVGVSNSQAFRWTAGGGMVSLDDLAGGVFNSHAFACSADGSVAVGFGTSASGTEAFRWTSAGGMLGLGDLAGGDYASYAMDTSADGSVVVGFGTTATGIKAFIWDATNGMRQLDQVLTGMGLDLTGFTLSEARGISDDGLTIVGNGPIVPGSEAWIVVLEDPTPAVPTLSPAAIALLGALLGVVCFRRLARS